jgi:hypothetical protein
MTSEASMSVIVMVGAVALTMLSAWNLFDARRTFQETEALLDRVENATDLRYLLTRYPPDVVRRAITQSQAVLSAEAGVRDPFPEPER